MEILKDEIIRVVLVKTRGNNLTSALNDAAIVQNVTLQCEKGVAVKKLTVNINKKLIGIVGDTAILLH